MAVNCFTCCSACQSSLPGDGSTSHQSPFALCNLLPLGTVEISVTSAGDGEFCSHRHLEDGWHDFQPMTYVPYLCYPNFDDEFCRGLHFLITHSFIRATFRHLLPDSLLKIRIYMIPYDLANVQGRLRIRKESVLSPGRQYLRLLCSKITSNTHSWEGPTGGAQIPVHSGSMSALSSSLDPRTLAEIYGDLPSPSPLPGTDDGICSRLTDFSDNLDGLGLRYPLFNYQRRSVVSMIYRETDLNDVPDPLYIPLVGVNGATFFYQPGTMEVLREQPMIAPCRGGILCEELGTGKTVMTLAVILATINELSTPEHSVVDTRPIITPLAFRHFPSGEFAAARKRFQRNKGANTVTVPQSVPSLRELLLHRLATVPVTTVPNTVSEKGLEDQEARQALWDIFELTPYCELRKANAPFYLHYDCEPSNRERGKRNDANPGPRVMYLTAATLIVVPQSLLSQWDREIKKHCIHAVRVLMIRSQTVIPNARVLATEYDIVLMSYNKLTLENNRNDVRSLHSWTACQCHEYPAAGVRVPNCQCKTEKVSPLLQVRWKRLIIDEGHVSATISSALLAFSKILSIERQWIVTGTPTTNLLGLSFGKKPREDGNMMDDTGSSTEIDETIEGLQTPLESARGSAPPESGLDSLDSSPAPPSSALSVARIWNRFDHEDVKKLITMITHFVGMPHFNANPNTVKTHINAALFDRLGPRPGAIQVLVQIMTMVMVRHRIEDVEKDIILPPVRMDPILLDMDPLVVKSYNALQAIIAINAVDSERKDQDYMFHARNVEYLQLTIKNMSQLMFWSVDDGLYNVDELIRHAETKVQTAIDRGASEADLALIRNAFKHIKLAAEDSTWRDIQYHEDVPYRIHNMALPLLNAWTRIRAFESVSPDQNRTHGDGIIHIDRLLKMRRDIVQHPLRSQEVMIQLGQHVAEKDRLSRDIYVNSLKVQKGSKAEIRKSGRYLEDSKGLKAASAAKRAVDHDTLQQMRAVLKASLDRLEHLEAGGDEAVSTIPVIPDVQPSALLASSVLAGVRVGRSLSSKLNYIIDEVLQHASTEKFIIFSDSPLTLAHVSEALELIGVRFLRFTTQVTAQIREQLVLTFETSTTYRVFLMELRHGARGLNLISASRIIFCEPVWQADVESQAIKRCHRIGQTKSITVKTLVIRGTAEENILERRKALEHSQEKTPKLIEEGGIRRFIENPKFIDTAPKNMPMVDLPLIPSVPPVDSDHQIPSDPIPPSRKRIWAVDPVDPPLQVQSPPKKIKTIRFTDQ